MDDEQQYCLKWNNHQSTLVAVFDKLLENGSFVDCTLAAEGKYLNAHKVVLSACSPFFESILSQHYDKHPILVLKDVKFQELKAMMDYMYRGEVNISQDQLGALLKAAESLQIKGLSDKKKPASRPPSPSKSPLRTSSPKVQDSTAEEPSKDEIRERSQSPVPRRRKRARRRSEEELENHHEASNSSESHSNNPTPAQNVSAISPAPEVIDVPEFVDIKSEMLAASGKESEDAPQISSIKEEVESDSELMLEPKSEYVDEMNEEDSIDALKLDDDDISNFESMDDGAGPSHSSAGQGLLDFMDTENQKSIPQKSKVTYEKAYQVFQEWCSKNNVKEISEDVLLAFLEDKSKIVKCSTLWSTYSMLKAMLKFKEGIDLRKYPKLVPYLKWKSIGHRPKKSAILTKDDINQFIKEADDKTYLLAKTVLIMGVAGNCRREELLNIAIDNIEDIGHILIVKVWDTKTHSDRIFTITNTEHIEVYRKYKALRPSHATTKRLFLKYNNGRCFNQHVGINRIGEMPSIIARFLGKKDYKAYTGHCFRRSATNFSR